MCVWVSALLLPHKSVIWPNSKLETKDWKLQKNVAAAEHENVKWAAHTLKVTYIHTPRVTCTCVCLAWKFRNYKMFVLVFPRVNVCVCLLIVLCRPTLAEKVRTQRTIELWQRELLLCFLYYHSFCNWLHKTRISVRSLCLALLRLVSLLRYVLHCCSLSLSRCLTALVLTLGTLTVQWTRNESLIMLFT